MRNLPKKYILVVIGALLAVFILLDFGVHGGNTENTVVAKVVSKLIPELSQQREQNVTVPNIPTPHSPKKEIHPFSITSDPTLLRGEGFFYVENGVLYRNKLENGVATEYAQKIAEGVQQTVAQNNKLALFTVKADGSLSQWNNELWVVDKELGTARKIYNNIVSVQISPQDDMLAVFQYGTYEVHLIDENGNLLNKVGIHGGEIAFSADGSQLAYHKLADSAQDKYSLAENAYGIAVYNLKTGTEFLATHSAGDFYPVEFSPDSSHLYFISDRGDHALWSVDLRNSEETQLSSPGVPVYINHDNAIWFSNKLSVVSETDGKVSLVQILPNKNAVTVKDLGEGTSPRWKIQDRVIEFKGKDGWATVDVSSFLKK